jgi:hypothetical protein
MFKIDSMRKVLLIILITNMLQGCILWELWDIPAVWGNFSINNMTDDTLTSYVAMGLEGSGTPTVYPDTCLPVSSRIYDSDRQCFVNEIEDLIYYHAVPPHTCKTTHGFPGDLNRIRYCDTLSVFIISRDTLMKYGYDDVRRNYRIFVRYDLSWDEAKRLGFVFPYPPTVELRNSKMYPSYESFQIEE